MTTKHTPPSISLPTFLAILLALIALFALTACGSPTEPTSRVETDVQTIKTGGNATHYNVVVRLVNGDVAFVCGWHNDPHTMPDGSIVKVTHMLSATPCSASGSGEWYQVPLGR